VYGLSADDLVQVGTVSLWVSYRSYDGSVSWLSFVSMKARQAMLDEVRRATHARTPGRGSRDLDVELTEVPERSSTSDPFAREHFRQRVRSMVDRDQHADALVRQYFDGMLPGEIAEATGQKHETIWKWQNLGRRQIASRYSAEQVASMLGVVDE
jgi:RNA polymerase sigma factor (sigma-70 family)